MWWSTGFSSADQWRLRRQREFLQAVPKKNSCSKYRYDSRGVRGRWWRQFACPAYRQCNRPQARMKDCADVNVRTLQTAYSPNNLSNSTRLLCVTCRSRRSRARMWKSNSEYGQKSSAATVCVRMAGNAFLQLQPQPKYMIRVPSVDQSKVTRHQSIGTLTRDFLATCRKRDDSVPPNDSSGRASENGFDKGFTPLTTVWD